MPSLSRRRLLSASALGLAAGGLMQGVQGVAAPVLPAADQVPLRFGLTPVFLDERVRLQQRWREVLQALLGRPVEFVQRTTYEQVVDLLRTRQVDAAWLCGYPYVLHQRELQLVCVPLWRGRAVYQSYLITDATGTRADLESLRGRSFAYSDPLSNSGWLYMQHLLRSLGEEPPRFFGRSFFTHSHRHVVEAVAEGLADGGAVDGYVWETLAETRPALTARTRVIARSPDFGFPPIVAAAGFDPKHLRALAAALQSMQRHADGRAVLAELRLDGFGAATPAMFQDIARMAREVGAL